jgi:hypothetical protein
MRGCCETLLTPFLGKQKIFKNELSYKGLGAASGRGATAKCEVIST